MCTRGGVHHFIERRRVVDVEVWTAADLAVGPQFLLGVWCD
jgi:hypothetical protein